MRNISICYNGHRFMLTQERLKAMSVSGSMCRYIRDLLIDAAFKCSRVPALSEECNVMIIVVNHSHIC